MQLISYISQTSIQSYVMDSALPNINPNPDPDLDPNQNQRHNTDPYLKHFCNPYPNPMSAKLGVIVTKAYVRALWQMIYCYIVIVHISCNIYMSNVI